MKVKNRLAFIFMISACFLLTSCDSEKNSNPTYINNTPVAITVSETYDLGEIIRIQFSLAADSYVLIWIKEANLLSDVEKYFHHLENINYFHFNQVISESNILINGSLAAGSHEINIDSNKIERSEGRCSLQ